MLTPTKEPRTLDDLRRAWANPSRRKSDRYSFVSSLNSLERYTGVSLREVPLDERRMQELAASVLPAVVGLTPRYWISLRSRIATAIKLFNNDFAPLPERRPLAAKWLELWGLLHDKAEKNILSSLVHWANDNGLVPQTIDDRELAHFERDRLARPGVEFEKYRRARRKLWNIVRDRHPELGLSSVAVPRVNHRRTRVPYDALSQGLRMDIDRYLHWCSGASRFRKKSRKRFLSPRSLIHHQNYIHAAADALVRSGIEIGSICGISDLLDPDRVREICAVRLEKAGRRDTSYNFELGRVLVQLARWLEVDESRLSEIREIVSEQERPPNKMTDKNSRTVSFFQTPTNLRRLLELPARLFGEARDGKESKRIRLAKLQAAVAIGILTFIPIRRGNLVSLQFGEHLEIIDGHSTLRIPRDQVKNKQPLEFDLPPSVESLLKEYRDYFVPMLTTVKHCQSLFIDTRGRLKNDPAVAILVKRYSKRYLGKQVNPHVFRHIAAKSILSHSPGAYPLVQDLLAHTNPMTAKIFYLEPDTKGAGRYHHSVMMKHINPES